jgi:hypothetical protein
MERHNDPSAEVVTPMPNGDMLHVPLIFSETTPDAGPLYTDPSVGVEE